MKQPKTAPIRDGFGEGLKEAAEANDQIVALCADLTESMRMNIFKDAFPERFIEMGISEQNMMGVAAGMAHAGKIPFVGSFAAFNPGRNWDQLRVSVCYSNLNVKVIGGHAGLTVGEDGATHQALEDIALTRVLPNLLVVVPCDKEQTRLATHAIAKHNGPCYLRSSRYKPLSVTTAHTPFELGKAQVLKKGSDITIIACGIMVQESLLAAEQLAKDNIQARVLNMHTIKPIDVEAIVTAAKETKAIITAEEHQVDGGLGSAVCEVLAKHHPTKVLRIGMKDTFGESGKADDLLDKYDLRSTSITKAAKKILL